MFSNCTCFSFAAWEIFLFNCSFHDEGGMCFAIGNHTYPILLYFVSRFVFILWKPLSASEQQDKIEWKLCGCFFLSFCHPLFLSFCLLLMPAPGKEGRQVLSCKQEGGVEVLWPEVITPVTSSAPPQHPPTLLPHPPQQNSKFTIHNLASSCNKPI